MSDSKPLSTRSLKAAFLFAVALVGAGAIGDALCGNKPPASKEPLPAVAYALELTI
ncbi:MAG: hypothetical protein ACAH83_02365 [Alphaproteobacteria bacterium]